jgi:hypothetical protein
VRQYNEGMGKGYILIVVAVILDGFQALIMASFFGAVSLVGSVLQFIPVVGTAVSGAISITGFVAGDAVDMALSLGFGTFLITLLFLNGMFYPTAVMGTSFIEILFPFLPGWTLLAVRSTYNKSKEDKTAATQTSLTQETESADTYLQSNAQVA